MTFWKYFQTPVIFERTTTGALDRGVKVSLLLVYQSSHHDFPEIGKNYEAIHPDQYFKKASTQTKTENSRSVGCEIIIYDSEKANRDYNIFSTRQPHTKCTYQ